ncbi:MAG TPA: hypothetical protein VEG84_01130, partial [Thermoanaerobaculia bacterium]|nr:hypothetical protein [Thermoanaerobaculia bacterium]
ATSGAPEARYPSAGELSAEVGRFLDGDVPLAHREGLSERAARFLRRYRVPILLILAYLVMRSLLILLLHR